MYGRRRIISITTWIAGVAAVSVALILPLGYFALAYNRLTGSLETEAEMNAHLVSGLINANPELWRFEESRLEELLARRSREGHPELRRILDSRNSLVAESVTPLPPPLVTRSHLLMDAGVPVGRIEISDSLRPLVLRANLVALLGGTIGVLLFVTLRVLPLRAVAQAEKALREANGALEAEIEVRRSAEERVRVMNAELELKVAERTRELLDAQEELVRKEKLATLGQLAGSVGHELRNPLGVMNNAVYFLKMLPCNADGTVQEYLGIIRDEIGRCQRILSDLLDFARTKTPQLQTVAFSQLLDETMTRCSIPENVTIRSEIPRSLPVLRVDPLQMGQVLQNLITNGIQAMPGGGTMRIGARHLDRQEPEGDAAEGDATGGMPGDPGPGFVEVRVTDTGVGIAPEQMKKLFHPLFTTKAKGLGLGLTVCRNLTEANGGRIEVESLAGEGTTFTLLLPTEREM